MVSKIFTLLMLSAVLATAELIPADQLTDWTVGTRVGVTGGIPTTRTQYVDATQSPYNADPTGVANSTTGIQNAINACPSNQYVYLPAGTYKVNSLTIAKSNITLRGAGASVTTLRIATSSHPSVTIGTSNDYLWSVGRQIVSSGNTRDSTVLTVPSASDYVVGNLARLEWSDMFDTATLDDGTTYVAGPLRGPIFGARNRQQMVVVTAKTSTTLTIWPGIIHTPQTGTTLLVGGAGTTYSGIGIEDLHIDKTDFQSGWGLWMSQCKDSWLKGVRVTQSPNHVIAVSNCVNTEITHCYAQQAGGGGTNGSGYNISTNTGTYMYDNIAYASFPGVEVNGGESGSVFAYNLFESTASVGCNINANHLAHNSHNLYEGNIALTWQSDGYHGSASQQTVFRNWFPGTNLGDELDGFGGPILNRWNSHNSIVGNLLAHANHTSSSRPISLGNPNIGNGDFTGTYNMRQNSFPTGWKASGTITSGGGTATAVISCTSPANMFSAGQALIAVVWAGAPEDNWMTANCTAASGTNYTLAAESGEIGGTTSTVWPANGTVLELWQGTLGTQGQDQGTFSVGDGGTTTLKANYFLRTGSTGWPAEENLGGDTLPATLYLSAKPSWFGTLAWPPFDPENPQQSLTIAQRYQAIPAGYRFVNGTDPPTSGGAPGGKKLGPPRAMRVMPP